MPKWSVHPEVYYEDETIYPDELQPSDKDQVADFIKLVLSAHSEAEMIQFILASY